MQRPVTPDGRAALRAGSARSLALGAAGALVGLGIAGYSLFTASGTNFGAVPPEAVAVVNQQPILMADYLAQLQTIYGVTLQQATPEQRRKILDDMIREELFVQRGIELDLQSVDPEIRSALVNAVEQQSSADALTQVPSEQALRAFYDAHPDKYASEGTMLAEDLVPATPGAAASVPAAVEALRQGMPVADAEAKFGLRPSGRLKGEDFYFAARIHLGDALFTAARGLTDGGVSDPVTAPDGPHVLVMKRNVPPRRLDFAAAREAVLGDYRAEQIARIRKGEEEFLRKRADILVAPGFGD